MKVKSITLRNILGIKEWSLDPKGPVTVISGHNAAGKSSVLKGLQTLIGGGNLANLKNLDAPPDEMAEGVLVLQSDDGDVVIKKNEKGLTVKKQIGDSQGFEDVPAPQRFLSAMYDAPAANPVSFLICKDKDRVDLLLEALDLEYSPGDLWARMGLSPEDFAAVPTGIHPLKQIARIREVVFKTRTGVNATEREKRGSVNQTRLKIPAELPTVESTALKDSELEALRTEYATLHEKAQSDAREAKAAAVRRVTDTEEKNRLELQSIEDAIKLEMATRLSEAKKAASSKLRTVQEESTAEISRADENFQFKMTKLDTIRANGEKLAIELAEIREQQKDQIRIITLHEQANEQEAEADDLLMRSGLLTKALAELDNYKAGMISNLPIHGLDVTDNIVRVDGVPWDQLNTEKQYRIAVKVACLRLKGDFKPVFIDGVEALDSKHFELLKAELEAAGAEAFVAKVDDGELDAE